MARFTNNIQYVSLNWTAKYKYETGAWNYKDERHKPLDSLIKEPLGNCQGTGHNLTKAQTLAIKEIPWYKFNH